MTPKAYWRLTFVLLVVLGAWVLFTALAGRTAPLTEIIFKGEEEGLRLPMALPFWRDLLAAPIISLVTAATISFNRRHSESIGAYGLARPSSRATLPTNANRQLGFIHQSSWLFSFRLTKVILILTTPPLSSHHLTL